MADEHVSAGENSTAYNSCPEALDLRISQTMFEANELEVANQELGSLPRKSNVYMRQGAGNVFFLSDRSQATSEYKRKLDEAKKGLVHLSELKQRLLQS